MVKLRKAQRELVESPDARVFVAGPAGAGKTTAAVARLRRWLDHDVDPGAVLIWVPQQTLAQPFYDLLNKSAYRAGGLTRVTTLGGLARRAVDLYWPLVADEAGFAHPERRPTFLSLETAQYYMARLVGPLIDERGFFDSVTIDRNRLYSQVIDNLNKAAVVGFPYTEVAPRLKDAWSGDDTQRRMYDDAQTAAETFRAYCLQHNLLDFSLQVEVFIQQVWTLPEARDFLLGQQSHLIAENVEEDTPAAHHILRDWLARSESALVVYDTEAGYRRFLGADPESALTLKDACDRAEDWEKTYVPAKTLAAFGAHLAHSLDRGAPVNGKDDPRAAIAYADHRYHPEMVDWVADEVASLVHDEGVEQRQIVILAPYLSDALRFALTNRLHARNVATQSHRPSRALREEPTVRALLTLAQIAHPDWRITPTLYDVIYALMESIADLDLVRAQLLGRAVYDPTQRPPELQPFDSIKPEIQQRITYTFGGAYTRLRDWLLAYTESTRDDSGAVIEAPLDHFFARLFGEILAQPGFGFHGDFDAADSAAALIDSARKFRRIMTASATPAPEGVTLAQEYVAMTGQGVIADQYLQRWDFQSDDAVLIAPAYTFLMTNRDVQYQFWLNVGGHGWSERLYQPLTNPYVLSRAWEARGPGAVWTDADEVEVTQEALHRLTLGLVRRCRKAIYLGFSELGEQGHEQRGALLDAIQRMLRRLAD